MVRSFCPTQSWVNDLRGGLLKGREVPHGPLIYLRSTVASLFFLLCFCLPTTYAQQTGEPIRVNVDRVNVGVIVTDSHGNFVEGLRREDLHVFDNGVEQPLSDFAAINEPANVVL